MKPINRLPSPITGIGSLVSTWRWPDELTYNSEGIHFDVVSSRITRFYFVYEMVARSDSLVRGFHLRRTPLAKLFTQMRRCSRALWSSIHSLRPER